MMCRGAGCGQRATGRLRRATKQWRLALLTLPIYHLPQLTAAQVPLPCPLPCLRLGVPKAGTYCLRNALRPKAGRYELRGPSGVDG
ncbi:hypothetical protein GGR52DRAFT_530807, partial [Hypoxylon sp. FL1284]